MEKPARLITIAFSHYCGLARWALDRGAVAYREEGHLPLASIWHTKRAGATRTTPALVLTTGEVLDSSVAILRYADSQLAAKDRLMPAETAATAEVDAWLARFDRTLGPATRRYAYGHLLGDSALAKKFMAGWAPAGERWLAGSCYPVLRTAIRRALAVTPAKVELSRARVDEVFGEVETQLADGRRYLLGDRFGAADLSFAALASPAVVPDHRESRMPALEDVPEEFAGAVRRWRARPAGQFVERLWSEHRGESRASVSTAQA